MSISGEILLTTSIIILTLTCKILSDKGGRQHTTNHQPPKHYVVFTPGIFL